VNNSFLQHISEPVILFRNDGTIVFSNEQAIQKFGQNIKNVSDLFLTTDYVKVMEFTKNIGSGKLERKFVCNNMGPHKVNAEIILERWTSSDDADNVLIARELNVSGRNGDIKIGVQKAFSDIVKTIHKSENLSLLSKHIVESLAVHFKATGVFLFFNEPDRFSKIQYFNGNDNLLPSLRILSDLVEKAQVSLLLDKGQIEELISIQKNSSGYRPIIWCGVPLKTKDKIIGTVGLCHDADQESIDEQDLKTLELLADQIYFALEYKISELKLIKAKLKAEQSDKLKSAFLANMSHEIRTPMNAIVGFGGLLLSDHVSQADKKYYYKQIKDGSNFLMQLIEDIIDVSRIETGDTTIIKNNFNFHALLTELYSQHQQLIGDHKKSSIEFKVYKPGNGELLVHSDQKRIRQVFKNLLSNSLKFTESGFIEFGYELVGESMLQCYVKDTGIGIDEGNLKNVFDSFTKVNESKTKIYGGTGIGLTICRQIVELLGGRIWADSQVGLGSTFFFTIPIEQAKDTARQFSASGDEVRTILKNKKVLIAEDNSSNFELLNSMLRKTEAVVIMAQDGHQAVHYLQNDSDISLVLLDIRMPGMDGLSVAKKVREFNEEVKIIAQTAYAFESDREEALNAGCDEFIVKPINQQILYNKIYKLFKNHS
jgi:signal transduction histidine kinase/ActR/RegA family two-component response regulator